MLCSKVLGHVVADAARNDDAHGDNDGDTMLAGIASCWRRVPPVQWPALHVHPHTPEHVAIVAHLHTCACTMTQHDDDVGRCLCVCVYCRVCCSSGRALASEAINSYDGTKDIRYVLAACAQSQSHAFV